MSCKELVTNWLLIHGFKPTSERHKKTIMSKIGREINKLIQLFGKDGYGDKPEDMDTHVYWLQHINYEDMVK